MKLKSKVIFMVIAIIVAMFVATIFFAGCDEKCDPLYNFNCRECKDEGCVYCETSDERIPDFMFDFPDTLDKLIEILDEWALFYDYWQLFEGAYKVNAIAYQAYIDGEWVWVNEDEIDDDDIVILRMHHIATIFFEEGIQFSQDKFNYDWDWYDVYWMFDEHGNVLEMTKFMDALKNRWYYEVEAYNFGFFVVLDEGIIAFWRVYEFDDSESTWIPDFVDSLPENIDDIRKIALEQGFWLNEEIIVVDGAVLLFVARLEFYIDGVWVVITEDNIDIKFYYYDLPNTLARQTMMIAWVIDEGVNREDLVFNVRVDMQLINYEWVWIYEDVNFYEWMQREGFDLTIEPPTIIQESFSYYYYYGTWQSLEYHIVDNGTIGIIMFKSTVYLGDT